MNNMEEKYQHLNNLYHDIKSFNFRLKKEGMRMTISEKRKYINLLNLSDDIINDIIQLIKDESGLTLNELIYDVNNTLIIKNTWRSEEKKYKMITNKTEFIEYLKTYYSNWTLLTNPIENLLFFEDTKKGYDFYYNLNKKIISKLYVFKSIIRN